MSNRILEIDTKVGLEIKYAVISNIHFLFMFGIQWKFSMNLFFIFFLVPLHGVSVSWTHHAHLVFSSYACCLENPFEAPEITESDE